MFIIAILNYTEPFLPTGTNHYVTLAAQAALAIIMTSTLEYITGWAMERFFHCKWWDYSDESFNIQGRICLKYSLLWGIISLGALNVLHPLFIDLISPVPDTVRTGMAGLLLAYFLTDGLRSAKQALGLQDLMADYNLYTLGTRIEARLDQRLQEYKRLIKAFPRLAAYHQGELKSFMQMLKQYEERLNARMARLEDKIEELRDRYEP